MEEPYKLPDGWKWVKLKDICSFIGGGTPNKSISIYWNGNIPWASIKDIKGKYLIETQDHITEDGLNNSSANMCEINDLLIATRISPGQVIIAKTNCAINQDLKIVKSAQNVDYLYYFFRTFEQWFINNSSGSTVKGITIKKVKDMPFPLAPLSTQQKIADLIDREFARLDKAKDKITSALDGAEARKQAILHKAFTGELTEKWREENKCKKSIVYKNFNEVATVKSNLVDPKEYQNFPHIAPNNIEKATGKLLYYKTISEDKVKSPKHKFFKGQILYSKIRPYLSKVVIAPFDGLCSADMYPIETTENTKYFWYYMLSDLFLNQACNTGSRSVLPKINKKELGNIKIAIMPAIEQQKIVDILDAYETKNQALTEKLEATLTQIDTLKKAILSKAFRGELIR